MDWTWLAAFIGGPTGLSVLAWLARRKGWSGHWLRRRLAAEKNLAQCQEELASQAASFDRRRADMAAELATRDRERTYLLSLVEQMTAQGSKVLAAREAGSLIVSPAPAPPPSGSSVSSPPSRRKLGSTANRSRSRPVVRNGPRTRGDGHEHG